MRRASTASSDSPTLANEYSPSNTDQLRAEGQAPSTSASTANPAEAHTETNSARVSAGPDDAPSCPSSMAWNCPAGRRGTKPDRPNGHPPRSAVPRAIRPSYVGPMARDADIGAAPPDQRERRRQTVAAARAAGRLPYRYPIDHTVAEIRAAHGDLRPDTRTTDRVRVAGRLELIRRQGGLTFADPARPHRDHPAVRRHRGASAPAVHREFDDLDRGDWVGVEGTVMTTRRGELSVGVESFALLGKALRRPPDKHRGLTDVETRYRQRYVDLEVNERTREIFRIRHTAVRAIRHHLEDRGLHRGRGPGAADASRAARRRGRSSPTTTRSTSTCTCGSRWSCTSSG